MITIGETIKPPVVCMETSKCLYDIVRSEAFSVSRYNALLMALVTYADHHNVQCMDKKYPWAERMPSGAQ